MVAFRKQIPNVGRELRTGKEKKKKGERAEKKEEQKKPLQH